MTGTNVLNVASGAPANGTQIQFTTIPTGSGLTAGATYYVVGSNGSTSFQLATTPTGSAIGLGASTVAGTGSVEGALTGLTTYATTFALNNNLDVTANVTAGLPALANSVRFNTAADTTLTLNGLNQVKSGGILVTSAVGANVSKITGGFGLAGTDRRGLTIFQNNKDGALQIDSVITDRNGAGSTILNKNGVGTLELTKANSFGGGGSNINEGKVIVTADSIAAVTLTGANTNGTNQITGLADTSGIFVGEAVTGASFTTANTSWIVTKIEASSVTLSSNSNVAGGTSFNFLGGSGLGVSGTASIAPGATLQIGNGGTTGNLISTQAVLNNGALIIDRSNAIAFANTVSGTGTLEKLGAGTLTLSGPNTYTGKTTVSEGNLTLTGSLASSTIEVATGATFTNNSIGALTKTFNLSEGATLAGSSAFVASGITTVTADLTGGFSSIAFGSFTKDGMLNLVLSNVAEGNYGSIFSGTFGTSSFTSVSISGTALTDAGGGVFSGKIGEFNFSYNDNVGINTLTISAVPEPATYAFLAGLGILGFVVYRRRTS